MVSRIEQLTIFYNEEPGDPFNLYSLALEYKNIDKVQSRKLFIHLLELHADYLPAYYMTADLLDDMGQSGHALEIIEKGLTLAQIQGNPKAISELKSLKNKIQYE